MLVAVERRELCCKGTYSMYHTLLDSHNSHTSWCSTSYPLLAAYDQPFFLSQDCKQYVPYRFSSRAMSCSGRFIPKHKKGKQTWVFKQLVNVRVVTIIIRRAPGNNRGSARCQFSRFRGMPNESLFFPKSGVCRLQQRVSDSVHGHGAACCRVHG